MREKFNLLRTISMLGGWGVFFTFIVTCLFILSVAIMWVYFDHYFGKFEFSTNNEIDTSQYGQIGDYIGGMIGTTFAIIGALLLFMTLLIQSEQLRVQQMELHSKQISDHQNKMLNTHFIIVNDNSDNFYFIYII